MKSKRYTLVCLILFFSCSKDVNNGQPSEIADVDGNLYSVVKIGTQVWTKENLKVTHYQNGDSINCISDDTQWTNNIMGAYCNYNNDTANVNTYGRLYNWYAIKNPSGLCPNGWHVPIDSEWTILTNYLGGQSIAGGQLKSTTNWDAPNLGATNGSNLTVYPAGGRYENGIYSGIGQFGAFWSSTSYDSSNALYVNMNYDNSQIYHYYYSEAAGYSCRCLMNQ